MVFKKKKKRKVGSISHYGQLMMVKMMRRMRWTRTGMMLIKAF